MDSGSTPSFIFACRDEDKLMLCAQGCIEANVNKQSQGHSARGHSRCLRYHLASKALKRKTKQDSHNLTRKETRHHHGVLPWAFLSRVAFLGSLHSFRFSRVTMLLKISPYALSISSRYTISTDGACGVTLMRLLSAASASCSSLSSLAAAATPCSRSLAFSVAQAACRRS